MSAEGIEHVLQNIGMGHRLRSTELSASFAGMSPSPANLRALISAASPSEVFVGYDIIDKTPFKNKNKNFAQRKLERAKTWSPSKATLTPFGAVDPVIHHGWVCE